MLRDVGQGLKYVEGVEREGGGETGRETDKQIERQIDRQGEGGAETDRVVNDKNIEVKTMSRI